MNAAAFGSGLPLVIDTSAWHRQGEPGVLKAWEAAVEAELLVSCPAAALEILGGVRDEREFKIVDEALGALPQAPVTASACRAALGACRDLGARRRIPAADYLIAAAAAERGFGVLHADKHFELLAEVLGFESVRVAAGAR
jgi:predicted nucleic acid-binding protein